MKPWYNVFGGKYTGSEPCFYDGANFPWIKLLEDNWLAIYEEVNSLLEIQPGRLKPYFINKGMSFPPRQWKTMGLYYWKFTLHGNCRKCPNTVRLIKSIPGMLSCSVSVLEKKSNINPHQGDTDAIIRCHLGLSVPAGLPDCGFQVGKEIQPWRSGKMLLFCDAHTHTAWNHSNERRVILILDVMRPEFIKQENRVCAHVLASSVLQMLYQSFPGLGKRSGYVKSAIYHVARLAILISLPFQRLSFR